jgi:tRNA threonylcarbamoyladenosine biosynthesis protein TsaB
VVVVAVDSTTDRLSVAAGSPDGPIVARVAHGARRHGAVLIPLVLEGLTALGKSLDDLGGLALADGPGGFTGLRVAAAWAKGVTRARNLPVWTASTLLLRAVAAEGPGRTVWGVGSALRGEWFEARYRFAPDGSIETIQAPLVRAPGDERGGSSQPNAIVGDDAVRVAAAGWGRLTTIVGPPEGLPEAARLIQLIGRPGGAALIQDVARWEPTYGRPAEAQVKWERAHGSALGNSSRHSS